MAFSPYEMELSDRQWFNLICGMQAGLMMRSADEPNADFQQTNTAGGAGDGTNDGNGGGSQGVPADPNKIVDPVYPRDMVNLAALGSVGVSDLWVYPEDLTLPIYTFIRGLSEARVTGDVGEGWYARNYFSGGNAKVLMGNPDLSVVTQQVYDQILADVVAGYPRQYTAEGSTSAWNNKYINTARMSCGVYTKKYAFDMWNDASEFAGISIGASVGTTVRYHVHIYVPNDIQCNQVRLCLAEGTGWAVDVWEALGDSDIASYDSDIIYSLPYKYYDQVVSIAPVDGEVGILRLTLNIAGGTLHAGWHDIAEVREFAVDVKSKVSSGTLHDTSITRQNITSLEIDGVERLVEERPVGTYIGSDAPARYNRYVGLLNAMTVNPSLVLKYINGDWVPEHTHPNWGVIRGHYNRIVTYVYSMHEPIIPEYQYNEWGYILIEDSWVTDGSGQVITMPAGAQAIGTLATLRVSARQASNEYASFISDVGGHWVWNDSTSSQQAEACGRYGYSQFTGTVSSMDEGTAYIGLFDASGKQVTAGVRVDLVAGDNQVSVRVPLYNSDEQLNGEYELRAFTVGVTPMAAKELAKSVLFNEGTAVSQSSASAPRLLSNPFAKDNLVFSDSLVAEVVFSPSDEDIEEVDELQLDDDATVDTATAFDGNVGADEAAEFSDDLTVDTSVAFDGNVNETEAAGFNDSEDSDTASA